MTWESSSENVCFPLKASGEAKELEIEADIEEDVMVEADGQLLSLVWNNLLSNAIKFTDDGGKDNRFPQKRRSLWLS